MEPEDTVQDQPQQPITLNLQDLRTLAGAIEISAQRGAFRAPEMEIVGAMYNKLALFLKVSEPAAPNVSEPAAPAEVADPTPETPA